MVIQSEYVQEAYKRANDLKTQVATDQLKAIEETIAWIEAKILEIMPSFGREPTARKIYDRVCQEWGHWNGVQIDPLIFAQAVENLCKANQLAIGPHQGLQLPENVRKDRSPIINDQKWPTYTL